MNKKKKIIFTLIGILIILLVGLGIFLYFHRKNYIIPTKEELKPTEYKRVKLEDGSEIINYGTCVSTEADETCYLVTKRAMLTLKNSKVTKESGDTTNITESENSGLNSAILVTYDCIAKLEKTAIITQAVGASGVYANGRKSLGTLKDTTIDTYKTNSPALAATNSGIITADHLTINTKVKDSPGILVVSKESEVEVITTLIETNGAGSPIINSAGKVTVRESTGTANASRIATIKDEGNVVINESSMLVSGGTNDKYGESAVLMYSNGKNEKNVFQAINSSLNINQNLPYYKLAPFFIVDNSNSEIDLENNGLNFGSNKLLKATNSNLTINLKNQVIYGEMEINNSKVTMNLIANSSYTGFINDNNTTIYLSKDSELNLTADMHIKELKNDDPANDNITLNGFHIYANNKLIK